MLNIFSIRNNFVIRIVATCIKREEIKRIIGKLRLPKKFQHTNITKSDAALQMLQTFYKDTINHIYDIHGHKESIDSLLRGDIHSIWSQSLTNELGRIAQGIGTIQGNDVIDFIKKM